MAVAATGMRRTEVPTRQRARSKPNHPASAGIRVGTSGWQYADWRDVLYPRGLAQRNWLSVYAESFDTVEVNATFYRLPTIEAVRRWATGVPAGFTFTIKASRYLSHIKRLREPQEPVSRLLERVKPLGAGGFMGPVLLQLPPDMAAAPELLEATLARLAPAVDVAVEFRHASWYTGDTRRVLERFNAATVWADRGGEATGPLWQTADWCYLRLHRGRSDWSYDPGDLRRWARHLAEFASGYAYTNNDPGGAAIHDARRLRDLLGAG
jgi:uncharacterized protein YecE (DUF72 family)